MLAAARAVRGHGQVVGVPRRHPRPERRRHRAALDDVRTWAGGGRDVLGRAATDELERRYGAAGVRALEAIHGLVMQSFFLSKLEPVTKLCVHFLHVKSCRVTRVTAHLTFE